MNNKIVYLFRSDLREDDKVEDIVLKGIPTYLKNIYQLIIKEMLLNNEIKHVLTNKRHICAFILEFDNDTILPSDYTFENLFSNLNLKGKDIKGNFMINFDSKKYEISNDLSQLLYLFNLAINREISYLINKHEN